MNNRYPKSHFYLGLILGATLPIMVGFFLGIYLFNQYETGFFELFKKKLGAPILALASLSNLIIFRIALAKKRNGVARGIVGGTILIALVVMGIKLIYWWIES